MFYSCNVNYWSLLLSLSLSLSLDKPNEGKTRLCARDGGINHIPYKMEAHGHLCFNRGDWRIISEHKDLQVVQAALVTARSTICILVNMILVIDLIHAAIV
jgi:hypothetical protein